MIQQESRVTVAIRDLPAIVVKLLERAPPQLLSGVRGQLNRFVRYIRSKPGRGLAITYSAGTLNGPRAKRTNSSDRLVTVSLPEALPAGTQIRSPPRPFQDAALEVPEPKFRREFGAGNFSNCQACLRAPKVRKMFAL